MSFLFFFILLAVLLILEVRLQRVVPRFCTSILLQAPKGHYVELNFTMQSLYPTPCIYDQYLEVRDGYNKSANLLGEFCGGTFLLLCDPVDRTCGSENQIISMILAGFGARTPTKDSILQVLSSEITN